MKKTKRILWIVTVTLFLIVSKDAFGQGMDNSSVIVDPANTIPLPPISQFPDNSIIQVTFDPVQGIDNSGISSPSALFSPSPVPEPSSFALLAAGLYTVAAIFRRSKARTRI